MPTHILHETKSAFYFVTFTCHKWLPLIDEAKLYSYLPSWIEQLDKRGLKTCGFVAMPNHLHFVIYVEEKSKGVNHVVGEGKRFMAYEIVKRLKILGKNSLLKTLEEGVQREECRKGKLHQVFRLSFDGKLLQGKEEIEKVLDYIHHNPVKGKWSLVDVFTDYPYSSASYYELGIEPLLKLYDYRELC